MILVDTSVWIDYFNGEISVKTDTLDDLLSGQIVIIGDLIFLKLLQGISNQTRYKHIKDSLKNLEKVEMLGFVIAEKTAENYNKLRIRGVTVRKSIDMVIGTYCIEHSLRLLHNDRDFLPMEKYLGLKTIS